jgi:maltose-binding protein MalE
MSKENMWERYEAYGIVPVRKSLQAQYAATDPEFNKRVLEYIDLGKGKPVVSFIAKFYTFAGDAWEKMYKGEKSPAEALQEVYALQAAELKK